MPQRNIVLGITGGIAAYKTAELSRLLVKRGDLVVPVMTPWAAKFLGPMTLEAITGQRVRVETPSNEAELGIEHISLIRAADILVIAPLTANTLGKMVHGLADNFLTTAYLAHQGPTLVCPAMNTAMLAHPATRRNLDILDRDGVYLLHGDSGSLACGEEGSGRMAEPAMIVDAIDEVLAPRIEAMRGKRVLVTTGPTREDIDPVRFISNRSSGKMGLAVARAFRNAGALVTLIHGPVTENLPARMNLVPIRTAAEMAEEVFARYSDMDIIVKTAAVADYRPVKQPHKLKKENFDGNLVLERTTDILDALGKNKKPGTLLAGFAAESENVVENAKAKLDRKNLDFIFANDITRDRAGFGSDSNHLLALRRDGKVDDLGFAGKDELARSMVALMAESLD